MKQALAMIKNGSTVYKAAKMCGIPWSTLKSYQTKYKMNPLDATLCKIGKPYVLPANLEMQLVSHINNMQELGFGLTVIQIREIAYKMAENCNLKHTFSQAKKMAGWNWWIVFKKRYRLTLRL